VDYIHQAFLEAKINLNRDNRIGGPFGAVIVKDGQIIAKARNQVTRKDEIDPTAHAEIVAIREAAKLLGTRRLIDCEIYTTCFPCPMCLGAIFWSGIRKVTYGSTSEFAAANEFDDRELYQITSKVPINNMGFVEVSDESKMEYVYNHSQECESLLSEWNGTKS